MLATSARNDSGTPPLPSRPRGRHVPIPGRFGIVQFAEGTSTVRRIVVSFRDAGAAEAFATEQGWHTFVVAPTYVAVPGTRTLP